MHHRGEYVRQLNEVESQINLHPNDRVLNRTQGRVWSQVRTNCVKLRILFMIFTFY